MTEPNSPIIGIDFGEKRVGIAVSDEGRRVAFPIMVLSNDIDLIGKIEKICKEKGASVVVLGESKDFSGNDNEVMKKIRPFKKSLEKISLEVLFHPEFMTTSQVERNFGKNDMIDASSAALILQSYLDYENNFNEK